VLAESNNALVHSCIVKITLLAQIKLPNELLKSVEDHLDEHSMASVLKFKIFDPKKTANLVELIRLIHQAAK
jgi:hypothetical protein